MRRVGGRELREVGAGEGGGGGGAKGQKHRKTMGAIR